MFGIVGYQALWVNIKFYFLLKICKKSNFYFLIMNFLFFPGFSINSSACDFPNNLAVVNDNGQYKTIIVAAHELAHTYVKKLFFEP